MIGDMMIGRRRFLTLTAGGVSAVALTGLGGVRHARAAETVRWVSPRGTVEVLDDYPYWVAKRFGYFGDIETTLEPGPSDATATVKLVDQNQADVGYPSPGVFSLGLAQGMPIVSVFHMGGGDVFSFAFRKGEKPADLKGLEGKTIVLGSAGWQAICDPMLKAAGVDITKVKYVDAGWPTWGTAVMSGRATLPCRGKACGHSGRDKASTSITSSAGISPSFPPTASSSASRISRTRRRRTSTSDISAAGRPVSSMESSTPALPRRSSWSSSRRCRRR